MAEIRKIVEKELENNNGILKLKPAWVARDFLPPGKRLGLPEKDYNVGERGFISERWLASVTKADNRLSPPDEGLSYLRLESSQGVLLKDAVDSAGDLIMGAEYAKTHSGLGRLAKIYDFASRIQYHIHQMQKDACLVGKNSKDEAYYFPEDVDTGAHPETFFGVHPYITEQKKYDILLPHLIEWKDDLILQHSRAYLNVPGEGFFLPSGVLHAPGTALTFELQEDSDVFAMLQAKNEGKMISKELLFKDVCDDYRKTKGERAIIEQINWEESGDPYFYENHHLPNIPVEESKQDGGVEHWVYYNTTKFSGKRVKVKPGASFTFKEKGVFNILVWRGKGSFDGHKIEAGNFDCDELLVSYDRAVKPITVKNEGKDELLIIKFFGPDINSDVPMIKKYK
ncbi:MAG: hypothetical protein BWY60_00032 [Actinobacteria bacterium ADurb.Bin346]|nr:MAG: hypothetical protein BWY60_00032 [Actinobacteria bacterium ADurb.Bin346]